VLYRSGERLRQPKAKSKASGQECPLHTKNKRKSGSGSVSKNFPRRLNSLLKNSTLYVQPLKGRRFWTIGGIAEAMP
jgi:hypothetical protein